MLVCTLIVTAEMILLLRLLLPDMIAYFEARHDAFYGVSDGDCRLSTIINHDGGV